MERRGEQFGLWNAVKASTALAVGNTTLFTVSGKVKLLSISGKVETAVSDSAVSVTLASVPTVGASASIAAVTSVRNNGLGVQYNITGTLANAITTSVAAGVYQAAPLVIPAGAIKLQSSATPAAGAISWVVQYVPMEAGARVI